VNVVFLPAARDDILSVVEYLLEQYAYDAAERFPVAVEAAAVFISVNPHAGAASLHGLRSWAVREFPKIRLYYSSASETEMVVVRVLHTARDVAAILENE